jgi:hypothetical protein
VNSSGTYPYFIYFYIVTRNPETDKLGPPAYYYWDPTITVNPA